MFLAVPAAASSFVFFKSQQRSFKSETLKTEERMNVMGGGGGGYGGYIEPGPGWEGDQQKMNQ